MMRLIVIFFFPLFISPKAKDSVYYQRTAADLDTGEAETR